MTVEELRLKWPVREVSVYGNCIVVPNKQFKREWEADLKAEGAIVLYQSLPGGTCALVRLKGRQLEPSGPTAVYQPRKKGNGTYQRWTPEEDARLMKRMGKLRGSITHKCNVLAREFDRPSVRHKYYRLRVKPEFRDKEPKLPTALPTAAKLPTAVHTELSTVDGLVRRVEVLEAVKKDLFNRLEEDAEELKLYDELKSVLRRMFPKGIHENPFLTTNEEFTKEAKS